MDTMRSRGRRSAVMPHHPETVRRSVRTMPFGGVRGREVVRDERRIEEGNLLHGLVAVGELLGEIGDVVPDQPGAHLDGPLVITAGGDLPIVATQGLNPVRLEFRHAALGAYQFLAIGVAVVFHLHASGDRSAVKVPRRLRNWTSSATISHTPRALPSSSW